MEAGLEIEFLTHFFEWVWFLYVYLFILVQSRQKEIDPFPFGLSDLSGPANLVNPYGVQVPKTFGPRTT